MRHWIGWVAVVSALGSAACSGDVRLVGRASAVSFQEPPDAASPAAGLPADGAVSAESPPAPPGPAPSDLLRRAREQDQALRMLADDLTQASAPESQRGRRVP